MDTQAWFLDGNAKFPPPIAASSARTPPSQTTWQARACWSCFGETACELHQLVIKAGQHTACRAELQDRRFFENGPGQYNLDIHPLFDDERRLRGFW
jgi:hypothetical protein